MRYGKKQLWNKGLRVTVENSPLGQLINGPAVARLVGRNAAMQLRCSYPCRYLLAHDKLWNDRSPRKFAEQSNPSNCGIMV
jgi:hypothetical protein